MKKLVALLPEGRLFDALFAESIAPAAESAGASVERPETEFSNDSKLGTICNSLEEADLIIADLTGGNPNVMYLLGYAHGIGRKVLLIAQHLENLPFDKSRHPAIGYAADRTYLRNELCSVLTGGTAPSQDAGRSPDPTDARAKFLSIFGDILSAHRYEHQGEVQLENPTTFVLLNQDMDLALVQDLARRARELGLRLKLM